MYLSAEKVLVGLSRVQTLKHLRIIPFAPGQTDNHLHSLRPNEVMLHWFAGYGNDGFWSAQNSAQSIAKNPLSSKKQSKTKSSVNSTKKASSSSSTPSKKFQIHLIPTFHVLSNNSDSMQHMPFLLILQNFFMLFLYQGMAIVCFILSNQPSIS
jgi:hypothetical protein